MSRDTKKEKRREKRRAEPQQQFNCFKWEKQRQEQNRARKKVKTHPEATIRYVNLRASIKFTLSFPAANKKGDLVELNRCNAHEKKIHLLMKLIPILGTKNREEFLSLGLHKENAG